MWIFFWIISSSMFKGSPSDSFITFFTIIIVDIVVRCPMHSFSAVINLPPPTTTALWNSATIPSVPTLENGPSSWIEIPPPFPLSLSFSQWSSGTFANPTIPSEVQFLDTSRTTLCVWKTAGNNSKKLVKVQVQNTNRSRVVWVG